MRSRAQLRAIFAKLKGKGAISRGKMLRKSGLLKFGRVGFGLTGKHLFSSESGDALRETPHRAARFLGSRVMQGYDIIGKTAKRRRASLKGGRKSERYD